MRTDEKTFIDRLRSLAAKLDNVEAVREELDGVRPGGHRRGAHAP